MWTEMTGGARHRLSSGGWVANLVIGIVLVLLTPVINSAMKSPRAAIISAAIGLTILIWVIAAALIWSIPGTNDSQTARAPGPTDLAAGAAREMKGIEAAKGALARTPKRESESPKSQAPRPTDAPTSQTMINSPGAIQAARDVIFNAEAKVVRAIELRVSVEATTPPRALGPEEVDVGLGSVVALFATDKERVRFASDYKVFDQQISATRRRIRFVYQPEDPVQILGRSVDRLAAFEVLAVNLSEIFKTINFDASGADTIVECGVILNGIPVANVRTTVGGAASLNERQANINVANAFRRIPAAYVDALGRHR